MQPDLVLMDIKLLGDFSGVAAEYICRHPGSIAFEQRHAFDVVGLGKQVQRARLGEVATGRLSHTRAVR